MAGEFETNFDSLPEQKEKPVLEDVAAYYELMAVDIEADVNRCAASVRNAETFNAKLLKYISVEEILNGGARIKMEQCKDRAKGIRDSDPKVLTEVKQEFEREAKKYTLFHQGSSELLEIHKETLERIRTVVSKLQVELTGEGILDDQRAKLKLELEERNRAVKEMETLVERRTTEASEYQKRANFFSDHLGVIPQIN